MSVEVVNPFDSYRADSGVPLDAGKLYVGVANLDPQTNPIEVFYDPDLTIAAPQPLTTSGGYVWRSGAPARIYVAERQFSMRLLTQNDQQIFYSASYSAQGDVLDAVAALNTDLTARFETADDAIIATADLDRANRIAADNAIIASTSAQDTVLLGLINALANGATKAYLTYAALDAAKATLPVNSFARVTNDPTPANNWIWQWDGTVLTKSDRDDLAVALAAVLAEQVARIAADESLSSRMANIFADNSLSIAPLVDIDGRRYLLAVVNQITGKLLFGVSDDMSVFIGNNMIGLSDDLRIASDSGREWVSVKDGKLRFFDLEFEISEKRGIFLNDKVGRCLFGISWKGTIHAAGLVLPDTLDIDTSTLEADTALSKSLTVGQHKLAEVNHEIVYGQSLSVSTTAAVPILSTTQPYQNIMLAGGVIQRVGDGGYINTSTVPLIEQGRETPVSGILNGLAKRTTDVFAVTPVFLGSTTGEGGKSIQYLSAPEFGGGSPNRFDQTIQYVRDCKALFDSQNKTYVVSGYHWIQGENDIDTPLYLYGQRLRHLKQELDSRILGITGQDFRPYMFMYQTAAHLKYGRTRFGAALSQLALCREFPDMIMAVPAYAMPTASDDLHLTSEGAWLMGQYFARAAFETRFSYRKFEPLMPVSVKWSGTTIDVVYNNTSALVLDNALCTLTPNFGFDIFKGAVDTAAISSVVVHDFNTIRINLATTQPMTAVLTCGRGRFADGAYSGNIRGARTNLRDSAGDVDTVTSPSGAVYAMHNPSVMFQFSRVRGFNAI